MNEWMFEAKPASLWRLLALFGAALVAFAAAIFVFPELLAYLVAALVATVGGSVLGAAWMLRRAEKQARGRRIPLRTQSPGWHWG